MSSPLAHVLAGVNHAKTHIERFASEAVTYARSQPCATARELDAVTGLDLVKVKLTVPMPDRLAFLAFDAVSNLRSCLDHAGFTAAKACGKTGANAHFPFGPEAINANRWASGEGRSRDIPKPIFDLMLRFQPYTGGDKVLCALNDLCNGSKHEIVAPMAVGAVVGGLHAYGDGQLTSLCYPPVWDHLQNEMVIATLHPREPFNMKIEVRFFVGLGQACAAVAGEEAIGFLNTLASKVEGIISAIEEEGLRTGVFK